MSWDQVRVLVDLPDHISEGFSRDEVTLVNAVSGLSVADTRRVVDYWRTAIDGPGVEVRVEELEDRRFLFASRTFEGMVKVDGLVGPLAGEVLLEALAAVTPPSGEGPDRQPKTSRRSCRPGPKFP